MISLRILFIFHDGPFAKRVFFSWQVVILRQHSATTTYFSSHDFWLKSCVLNEKSFLLRYFKIKTKYLIYCLYTFSSKLSTQVRQTNEFWVYLKKHKSLVFTAW